MTSRGRVTAMAVAMAIAVAGCGLGAGRGTTNVTVTVTRGFGTAQVAQLTERSVPGSETVMRMLERHFSVTTRYGGGFVESISGLSASSSQRDWFYYVNGVQAPQGAATTTVHRGDRIWWDLHDWNAAESIPAVVGSFPEPFVHGVGGKRLPTVIECATDVTAACHTVSKLLGAIGIPVAMQAIGTGSGTDTLAVQVGTWRDLRDEIVASLIAKGPGTSGVYARFAGPAGSSLELLDPHARVAQTLGAGTGLVAATAQGSTSPTWVITGTDAAGVAAAAAALTPARLDDHFALAVQGSRSLPIPLRGST